MIYSVTLFTPVATPHGIAVDRWEFPRLPEAEALTTIHTAQGLGWDYHLAVSLRKDEDPFTVQDSPVQFCGASYPWLEDTCCDLAAYHEGDHEDHDYDAPATIAWAQSDTPKGYLFGSFAQWEDEPYNLNATDYKG